MPVAAAPVTIDQWGSGADQDADVVVRVWVDLGAGSLCIAWTASNLGDVTAVELTSRIPPGSPPTVIGALPVYDPGSGSPECTVDIDPAILATLATPASGASETPTGIGYRLYTDEFVEPAWEGLFWIEERGTYTTTHYACPRAIDTPDAMDAAGASAGCVVAIREDELGTLPVGHTWRPSPVLVEPVAALGDAGGGEILNVNLAPELLTAARCDGARCSPPEYRYRMEDPGIGGPELDPRFGDMSFPSIPGYREPGAANADATDNLGRVLTVTDSATEGILIGRPVDADVVYIRIVYSRLRFKMRV